jgi:hypothetical protein
MHPCQRPPGRRNPNQYHGGVLDSRGRGRGGPLTSEVLALRVRSSRAVLPSASVCVLTGLDFVLLLPGDLTVADTLSMMYMGGTIRFLRRRAPNPRRQTVSHRTRVHLSTSHRCMRCLPRLGQVGNSMRGGEAHACAPPQLHSPPFNEERLPVSDATHGACANAWHHRQPHTGCRPRKPVCRRSLHSAHSASAGVPPRVFRISHAEPSAMLPPFRRRVTLRVMHAVPHRRDAVKSPSVYDGQGALARTVREV